MTAGRCERVIIICLPLPRVREGVGGVWPDMVNVQLVVIKIRIRIQISFI